MSAASTGDAEPARFCSTGAPADRACCWQCGRTVRESKSGLGLAAADGTLSLPCNRRFGSHRGVTRRHGAGAKNQRKHDLAAAQTLSLQRGGVRRLSQTSWCATSTDPQRHKRGTGARQIDHDRARIEPGVFSSAGRPAAIVIDRGPAEPHASGGIERRRR
jgi:hypothetical protein